MKPLTTAILIPREPILPIKETIFNQEIGDIDLKNPFSFQQLQEAIFTKCCLFDIDKVRFEIVGDDFASRLYAYLPIAAPNPNYEQQQAKYEEELLKYQEQMKTYNEQIEKRNNSVIQRKLTEARKTVKELEDKLKESK